MTRISSEQARALVLRGLGIHPESPGPPAGSADRSDVQALTVHAAALRAVLWALSTDDSSCGPVYVRRLLHAARPLASCAIENVDNAHASPDVAAGGDAPQRAAEPAGTGAGGDGLDVLRTALDELKTIGDVAELPRGYWLPAPLRCVPLPAVGRYILAGGRPTHYLPAALRSAVGHNGAARFLATDPAELGHALPREPMDEWVRVPTIPLSDWAASVLASAPVQTFDDPDARFECYAPGAKAVTGSRGQLQYFRWIGELGTLADGRYLARHVLERDSARYAVADLRAGIVVGTGPLELGGGDLARLRYGLDLLTSRPATVRVTDEGSARVSTLGSELPAPEQRLFTALGRLQLSPDGRYFPRRWVVPVSHAAQAEAALERLGIRLETTRTAG